MHNRSLGGQVKVKVAAGLLCKEEEMEEVLARENETA